MPTIPAVSQSVSAGADDYRHLRGTGGNEAMGTNSRQDVDEGRSRTHCDAPAPMSTAQHKMEQVDISSYKCTSCGCDLLV